MSISKSNFENISNSALSNPAMNNVNDTERNVLEVDTNIDGLE